VCVCVNNLPEAVACKRRVTHPNTNRTRRTTTLLTGTNKLPLRGPINYKDNAVANELVTVKANAGCSYRDSPIFKAYKSLLHCRQAKQHHRHVCVSNDTTRHFCILVLFLFVCRNASLDFVCCKRGNSKF